MNSFATPVAAAALTRPSLRELNMTRDQEDTDKAPKAIASTQSLSAFVKSICDIMRRSNCASALQYVPELTWILFLRILDAQEERDQRSGRGGGRDLHARTARSPTAGRTGLRPSRTSPSTRRRRGQALRLEAAGTVRRRRRQALRLHQQGTAAASARPGRGPAHRACPTRCATPKQRIIGRIMTAVERVRVDSRDQSARHPRQGARDQHRPYRRHAFLHAVAGV